LRAAAKADSPLEALALAAGQVPTPLFDGYAAFMAARTLMAGCNLGVFASLREDGPATAAELAGRLGYDPLGTDALLTALHTMEYLEADGDRRYSNAAVVDRWLKPLEPFVGVFTYDMWEVWSGVEDAVRTGTPAGLHDRPDDDPHWERYMRGLYALSELIGPTLARAVGVPRGATSLLDVAGGHGGLAKALCDRTPGLQATVLELEGAARTGRALAAEHGFADRVRWEVGDMFTSDLGGPHDVVLAGQILHHLAPEDCVRLLSRCREATGPGGIVAVYEQERPPDGKRGHQIGVLTGLMFFAYSRARTYTADEVCGFMRDAGLGTPKVKRPLRMAGTFVATATAAGRD
jgi:2-polyprenyl-3-methyl-5-hydroxy-6-metoxy-1,4-benzoquinol methylase